MLVRPPGAGSATAASATGPAATIAPAIAVIVPIRNEAGVAHELAARLARLRDHAEVLVVDGDSDDDGPAILRRHLPELPIARAPRGRARQMNAGARLARADVLLFLHADTELAPADLAAVEDAVQGGAGFGCFRVRIDSPDARLRLAARLINLRSRLFCSATGDQAMFVRRDLFEAVGGFPDVELCEDLELVRRLRGRARFAPLDRAVRTSARRWERCGVARTIALMWSIRTAWHLGVPPQHLARLYREVR